MIQFATPLPIGNAVALFVHFESEPAAIRILRRTDDAFTGPDDAAAVIVFEGEPRYVVDHAGLVNGQAYSYRLYSAQTHGDLWVEINTAQCTPKASYQDESLDVVPFVIARLEDGLHEEVARQMIQPRDLDHAPRDCLPIQNAYPQFGHTPWPVVSVHLDDESTSERGIGELLTEEAVAPGGWEAGEGWLSRIVLTIMGWSLNPTERIAMRAALRRVLVANLPVFSAAGMDQIDLRFSDVDEMERYPAPVYAVSCALTCLAPVHVVSSIVPISDVHTDFTTRFPGENP